MMLLWCALNRRHLATAQCAKGLERKSWRLAEEYLRESMERAFQAYVKPPDTITSFKYLGWVMTAGGDDWPATVGNLRKYQKIWAHLTRILGREGADPRVSRIFSKALVRAVLIFGSET